MALETIGIYKYYGKRCVVKNVYLTVTPGKVIGLLGPNGAGKTTTFYTIMGEVFAEQGKVLLDGEDITYLSMPKRARKGIGYLAQDPTIFRKLTVEENIKLVLELTDLSPLEQKRRLEELIDEFKLQELRKNLGYTLSGGERRRVEIARVLALSPKYILLDEPFAGVDPLTVQNLQETISYLSSKGLGILVTDHNVRDTLEITDYAYIISSGEVLISGTPEEIINNEVAKKIFLGERFNL
ncbi:MAG TPA: LPS export ABC transporter ATP-binding protein [Dictyoglomaceae bacterium]|nr:LPS export ABC transporter ATP-binding protein [Dictyoglomaceae bacterium]HOL40078.1 LPS export ABC transporter ATP-binding protein [Dictyoglomaceae bacterium]HOP95488.1 LPS export ABC transporter ATP-binding protein [Dictyoglomaceae bacterium]HPP16594.1 LPS export ABC transporter ATP-binding protein [Dictyoglomaceae bacterium]HPU43175.1 LPS export ABC transporter ATP-binding protein [Dictyoglomaceae bacterium]